MPVANLVPKPDRPARVLLTEAAAGGAVGPPLAVQAGYGLGRVTVLAFDLDRPPFTDYDLRASFWDWVLRECGAALASGGEAKEAASGTPTEDGDELAAALRTHVDTFQGVPVISFGWVAVFIVLYILLIGPVEYYVLKRVFGRLELTWVTFPLIVLAVSAAAYFTAYAVKGRDLRVNKVDVVEVDAAGGRAYGQTWFTLFSPRIDTYTVTATPAAGWAADAPDDAAGAVLTDWVGGPRGGRAGLVRRGYRYDVREGGAVVADALDDVPVQVWSTKSFTARWSARLSPTGPAVESRLTHPPGDPAAVVGTFVNRMPFGEVRDAVAIYAGQAYPKALGTLLPGVERRLVLTDPVPVNAWLADATASMEQAIGAESPASRGRRPGDEAAAPASAPFPMLGAFFHESAVRKDQGFTLKNASLRRLDQTWRLSEANRDEVIVVGRVAAPAGTAEETLGGRYSPSQLWLKGRPGDGRPRPEVLGVARQETYVRLYLPVR